MTVKICILIFVKVSVGSYLFFYVLADDLKYLHLNILLQ